MTSTDSLRGSSCVKADEGLRGAWGGEAVSGMTLMVLRQRVSGYEPNCDFSFRVQRDVTGISCHVS
jgi:hypothetical protein